MNKTLDIVAIGNAIVDILSHVEEHVVSNLGLRKSTMGLVDEAQGNTLYEALGVCVQSSGGSAANTIAGMASLGAKCGFIGKVKNDTLGKVFQHDLKALGVEFPTSAATHGAGTGRCLVYVTPDGERTMATYLGACGTLTKQDIDTSLIKRAKLLYIEGYLWDQPEAIKAIEASLAIAKTADVKTAFTLSDTFCVTRHRDAFKRLASQVDILFANEAEICALYEVSTLDEALVHVKQNTKLAAITRSGEGATIIEKGKQSDVSAPRVAKVVDTTGAGDLFAAGFLFAYARGESGAEAAKLGHALAGHIIQQLGPRSATSLKSLYNDLAA